MLSTKAIVIFRIDIKRMKNYKRVKNKDGMQEEHFWKVNLATVHKINWEGSDIGSRNFK